MHPYSQISRLYPGFPNFRGYFGTKANSWYHGFLALILGLSLSAVAQTPIKYFPSHPPTAGSIPQACLDEGDSLKAQLTRFPHPDKWTFVIACDDHAWDDLLALAGHAGTSRVIFGATNPDNHSTLLRGTTLVGKDREMTPEHLVAHELAHVYLHSSNERRVGDQALEWMKSDRGQPVLRTVGGER